MQYSQHPPHNKLSGEITDFSPYGTPLRDSLTFAEDTQSPYLEQGMDEKVKHVAPDLIFIFRGRRAGRFLYAPVINYERNTHKGLNFYVECGTGSIWRCDFMRR